MLKNDFRENCEEFSVINVVIVLQNMNTSNTEHLSMENNLTKKETLDRPTLLVSDTLLDIMIKNSSLDIFF